MIENIKKLLGLRPSANLDAVVRQVTEDSLPEVCQQVVGRTGGMNFAEARGYVRARASRIVLRHARIVIARSAEVEVSELQTVARFATERLVPHVIRQARVGVPAMPVLRRAA